MKAIQGRWRRGYYFIFKIYFSFSFEKCYNIFTYWRLFNMNKEKENVSIKVLDQVWSKIMKGKALLRPCLSYPEHYYKQTLYQKIRKDYRKSLINKDNTFLTGFVPMVRQYCASQNIPCHVNNSLQKLKQENNPKVADLNISEGDRKYQRELILSAIKHQRGIIKAATASGKTIIMLGIISCFPNAKVLFLSDTHVPTSQMKEAIQENGFENYNINLFTIQKFHRLNPDEYIDKYDIIIVDECHSGASLTGMYAKVLMHSLATMRFGFTATLPSTISGRMALEGLFGPIIGEFSIQDGMEHDVLSKPKIILKMLPENSKVRELRTYKDVYDAGVVNNRALNRQVILDAKESIEENKTVLILVVQIQHGENIVNMAKRLYDLDFVFVQGKTDSDIREQIRKQMIDKKTKAVVATAVFRKALNIPSLDVVINACGGKSEVMTLQAIGRGLRKTKDKEEVIIRDYYIPSHRYLVDHFGRRLCLYFQEKWL